MNNYKRKIIVNVEYQLICGRLITSLMQRTLTPDEIIISRVESATLQIVAHTYKTATFTSNGKTRKTLNIHQDFKTFNDSLKLRYLGFISFFFFFNIFIHASE